MEEDFDFIMLFKGDKLIIKKEIYEVLKSEDEVENIHLKDDVQDIYAKSYVRVELHKQKSKSLFPTHELRYYNKNKIYLFRITQRKTKGAIFSYKNQIKISLKDIEVINKLLNQL